MNIPLSQAKPGDTVLFKGNGPLFAFFNFALSTYIPKWRRLKWKPWHMGKLWGKTPEGWFVMEAWTPISRLQYYSNAELEQRAKVVAWLGPLDADFKMKCEQQYLHKPYDVTVYFWTMAQYFVRHYWNRVIPRLLDDRYTCWELVQSIDCDAGKGWGSKYDCVMITDFPPLYEII